VSWLNLAIWLSGRWPKSQFLITHVGMKTKGLRKAEMIKEIQRNEGNFDCFGTATDYCDQMGCLFREDCLS